MRNFKTVLYVGFAALLATGCSINPATGDKQFAALMSPAQEAQEGAKEHADIIKTYGLYPANDPVQAMVSRIGARVSANTERSDVTYKFFVLDSPIVNAFALPGGYIYVSRGLLAQANSEAELAGVLAHEVGHITARHSAERYSHGVLASLGAVAVAAATGNAQVAKAASVGSDLYIKSYSRGQESQADILGIRYLSHAGYDPYAMASFLASLEANDDLQQKISGGSGEGFSYFSTHPRTADRVMQARAEASSYPAATSDTDGRDAYLKTINGIVYGDSAKQGFVRGGHFWHPGIGFTFDVPRGFAVNNEPAQITVVSKADNSAVIFDQASNANHLSPEAYIHQAWMKGRTTSPVKPFDMNSMPAAMTDFTGSLNNTPVTIRVIAVAWSSDTILRFQVGIPQNASQALAGTLESMTYSLRRMSDMEIKTIKPYHIEIVTARPGETVASLASKMAPENFRDDRLRVLNAIKPNEGLDTGRLYKIIAE